MIHAYMQLYIKPGEKQKKMCEECRAYEEYTITSTSFT